MFFLRPLNKEIVKLLDYKRPSTQTLDSVSAKIRTIVQHEKAQKQFSDARETLADEAFSNPDSLEPVAKALQLTVHNTGFFTASSGTPGTVTASPAVRAVAFSEDVLQGGNNSEPVTLGESELLVLRVSEHKPSTAQTFEQVKDQIRQLLARQAEQRAAQDLAEKLAGQTENSSAALRQQYHLKPQVLTGITRQTRVVSPELLEAIFNMTPPTPPLMQHTQALPTADGYAVVTLTKVVAGDERGLSQEQKLAIQNHIANSNGLLAYDLLLDSALKHATVVNHLDAKN